MRVLILGGNGMLGHKLVQRLNDKFEVWSTQRKHLSPDKYPNIFLPEKTIYGVNAEIFKTVKKSIAQANPDVIVNAIGVIKQNQSSNNVVKNLIVNSILPHRLANLAQLNNIRLINISTDCVFSGTKGNYRESDVTDALDLYGRSKFLGEVSAENCLTLRTSIIGRELKTNHSLVEWFLSQAGKKVKGYKNAIFSGFPTVILADIIADLIAKNKKLYGLYHVSSQPISKFDLLTLLKKAYQIKIEIEPFEEFKIDRSLNSAKFRRETNFQPMSWNEMVKKMAEDPFPYDKLRK
ncbi:MAG: SDR family oxidoreductase [Acidobacteriota bacterium]|nr:SDR family oxidoreductase [Acidobacteriota bacterium]